MFRSDLQNGWLHFINWFNFLTHSCVVSGEGGGWGTDDIFIMCLNDNSQNKYCVNNTTCTDDSNRMSSISINSLPKVYLNINQIYIYINIHFNWYDKTGLY